MKLSNIICLLAIIVIPFISSAQLEWESYDHSQLFNTPASVYPYKDGIIVPTLRGFLKGQSYSLSGFKSLYFNFYDNEGSIQSIGNIGYIHNIYDNIQYRINTDSTLSILVFGSIDYDIPGQITEIDFDGSNASVVLWDERFEVGNEQVTFFGENRYLVIESDSTFFIDENHQYASTISYLQQLKLAYTHEDPILYDDNTIYSIASDESLLQIHSGIDIERVRYLDKHYFVSTTSEIIQYDLEWKEVGRYPLLADYRWSNITGSKDQYYFYFETLSEPRETIILESIDNSELILIDPMVDAITHISEYQYRLTTDTSEKHMHSLVNRSPLDTVVEDYDYMDVTIENGIVELDSIVYGGYSEFGPDTIHYDYYYYTGFVNIKNESADTLRNTELHSTPIRHGYPSIFTHIFTFSVDTLVPPQEVYRYEYDFRIQSSLNMDSFNLVIYGANDRRLKEPLSTQFDIIGSVNNNLNQEVEIEIYPNPATNYFEVTCDHSYVHINLYGHDGTAIRSYEYSYSGEYDIGQLSKGYYYAQIIVEDGSYGVARFYISR